MFSIFFSSSAVGGNFHFLCPCIICRTLFDTQEKRGWQMMEAFSKK